jgi:SAM-dependent methyltransferase
VAAPIDPKLAAAIEAYPWYHTIELAPGLVTQGFHDDRSIVDRIPWPGSLEGLRCLEVGPMDGFWSFEMERRGAAEVTAVDLVDVSKQDWPFDLRAEELRPDYDQGARRGEGFALASKVLGSKVQYVDSSIYDLSPAKLGEFDLVFLGRIVEHLRSPMEALEAIRSVCRGWIVWFDQVRVDLSILHRTKPLAYVSNPGTLEQYMNWFVFNRRGMERVLHVTGFTVEETRGIKEPIGPRLDLRSAPLKARLRYRLGMSGQAYAVRGRARPQPG